MIPIFYKVNINKIIKSNININLKITLITKFFITRVSSILGKLLDTVIGTFLEKKFIFVRTDINHFGSWVHLFFTIKYFENIYPKKFIVAIAKNGTINPIWIKYFKNGALIVTNPILRILIMPFFFSRKAGFDANGINILSHSSDNKIVANYKSLPPLSNKVISSIYKRGKNEQIISEMGNNKKYILFYAREGNWKHSSRNSIRNMPKILNLRLISKLLETHNIVVIGDTQIPKALNYLNYKNKIFLLNDLLKKNYCLYKVYSNASFVIGSCSGATHFPSMLFNKETLYITDGPIRWLDALYMVPTKYTKKNYKLALPDKDKWLIAPQKEMSKEKIIKTILDITEDFINRRVIRKNKNFNKFKYIGPMKNAGRTLVKNEKGNIILHNDVPLNSKVSDIF